MKKGIKIQNYFTIFEPAEEGGFNVTFPDFPGCVTFGRTFEEAKKMATEVLELWITELVSQRKYIPNRVFHPIIDQVSVAIPA